MSLCECGKDSWNHCKYPHCDSFKGSNKRQSMRLIDRLKQRLTHSKERYESGAGVIPRHVHEADADFYQECAEAVAELVKELEAYTELAESATGNYLLVTTEPLIARYKES